MLNFNNPNLARRLTKIASAVGMAETRIAVACDDLRLYASHVPEVAEALQYLVPAARFLEPLFDELHKIINDPACAGSTLSEFESECPMFAQVASLTEQVDTLKRDVSTLVDLNREFYDGLRILGELAAGRAVAKSN